MFCLLQLVSSVTQTCSYYRYLYAYYVLILTSQYDVKFKVSCMLVISQKIKV